MSGINAEHENALALRKVRVATDVTNATISMEYQLRVVRASMRVVLAEGGRGHELAILDALRELDSLQARSMDLREMLKTVQT